MAQKTRTQIQTEINAEIVSNNDRGITADMLNTVFTDINDSTINSLTDGTTLGLYQFDISKSYNLNQAVIFNNQIYKANQNVTAGTFSSVQWNIVGERKCVLNLIGNTSNNPTVYSRFDNLFSTTPTVTRLSTGVFQVACPTSVFGGTNSFSIEYGGWDNSTGLPAFPISQNVPIGSPGNNFEIVTYNYNFTLTDLFKGYLIITKYN